MKQFEKERQFYKVNKAKWFKDHDHEFALIKGDKLFGFYPSFQDAFNAGVEKIGIEKDFYIEEILEQLPTNFIYTADIHAHS